VLAAGFALAGKSKVLENPQDAHTVAVFDPSIRGKTDQFYSSNSAAQEVVTARLPIQLVRVDALLDELLDFTWP